MLTAGVRKKVPFLSCNCHAARQHTCCCQCVCLCLCVCVCVCGDVGEKENWLGRGECCALVTPVGGLALAARGLVSPGLTGRAAPLLCTQPLMKLGVSCGVRLIGQVCLRLRLPLIEVSSQGLLRATLTKVNLPALHADSNTQTHTHTHTCNAHAAHSPIEQLCLLALSTCRRLINA